MHSPMQCGFMYFVTLVCPRSGDIADLRVVLAHRSILIIIS